MDPKEIRMRCVEAATRSGISAPNEAIKRSSAFEEWVLAAQDKEPSPAKATRKKTADKS